MSTTALERPALTFPRLPATALRLPAAPARVRWVPAQRPARSTRPAVDPAVPPRAVLSPGRTARRGHPAAAPVRGRDCRAAAPLRLTRRGRLVITCTAATVITGAVLAVAGAVGGASAVAGTGTGPVPAVVTVLPGQTLSQIAGAWAPGDDWRDVAAEIVELNEMSSQAVQAGQRLTLPARD